MTLLICGANGQVGSELAARCQHGDIALDRMALDITQPDAIAAALDRHQPRVLINAAAYTAVDRAEQEPKLAHAINGEAVAHLARACAQRDISLLHLSTDYVFDGSGTAPYAEDATANPLGVYGASKWAGEQALRQHCPRHLILRVSWVFGQHGNNFVKTMLRLGAERPALRVVSDQVGGPTAAADIAATLMQLARRITAGESLPWGTWHFAGQPCVSWHGFAEAIFAQAVTCGVLARAPEVAAITAAEFPTLAQRPAQSSLSMTATTAALDLQPPDWRVALNALLQQRQSE